MAHKRLFGTDGIRGKAGEYPLDDETVARTGLALAQVLRRRDAAAGGGALRVVIGRDTRESGLAIERALGRGLRSGGAEVHSGGVLTTPAVSFVTTSGGFAAGIVISASHNPFGDNGLKVFSADGYKLSDEVEAEVEGLVLDDTSAPPAGDGHAAYPDGTDHLLKVRYLKYLRSTVDPEFSFEGRPVVVDCANGAAAGCAPDLFRRLGATVHAIGVAPSGRNINDGCGSLFTGELAKLVVDRGAYLGIAYDGDADRCILVDETGTVCDGDDVLAVAATALQRASRLGGGDVISTVMANLGLEQYIGSLGLGFVRTPVGDKSVLEEMRRRDAKLGGEQSGHILFLDHATTGDGILTSLLLSEMIIGSGQPLSKLTSCWTRLPQVLVNVRVKERKPLEETPELQARIGELEAKLAGHGRLLVRYSGTEPLLRIMLEGRDKNEIDALASGLADDVRRVLG